MDMQVIGDELHVDGHVVALLATRNVPATLMDRVVRGLDGAVLGTIPDDTGHDDVGMTGVRIPSSEDARDDLLAKLGNQARSGLLRLDDVNRVVRQHYDGE